MNFDFTDEAQVKSQLDHVSSALNECQKVLENTKIKLYKLQGVGELLSAVLSGIEAKNKQESNVIQGDFSPKTETGDTPEAEKE